MILAGGVSSKRVRAAGPSPNTEVVRSRLSGDGDGEIYEEEDDLESAGRLVFVKHYFPDGDLSAEDTQQYQDQFHASLAGIRPVSSAAIQNNQQDSPFVVQYESLLKRAHIVEYSLDYFWKPLFPVLFGQRISTEGKRREALTKAPLQLRRSGGEAVSGTWHFQPHIIDGCVDLWFELRRDSAAVPHLIDLFKQLAGANGTTCTNSELALYALLLQFAVRSDPFDCETLPTEELRAMGRRVFRGGSLLRDEAEPCIVNAFAQNDGFPQYMDSVGYAQSTTVRPVVMRLFTGLVRSILDSEDVLVKRQRQAPPSTIESNPDPLIMASTQSDSLVALTGMEDSLFPVQADSIEGPEWRMPLSPREDEMSPAYDDFGMMESADIAQLEELCRSTNARSTRLHTRFNLLLRFFNATQHAALLKDCSEIPRQNDLVQTSARNAFLSFLQTLGDESRQELLAELARIATKVAPDEASSFPVVLVAETSPRGGPGMDLIGPETRVLDGLSTSDAVRIATAFFDNAKFHPCRGLLLKRLNAAHGSGLSWLSTRSAVLIDTDEILGALMLSHCRRRQFSTEKEDLSMGIRTHYQDGTLCELRTGTTDDVVSSKLGENVEEVLALHQVVLDALARVRFESPADRNLFRAEVLMSRSQLFLEDRQLDEAERDLAEAIFLYWEKHKIWNHPDLLNAWWVYGRLHFRRAETHFVGLIRQHRAGRPVDSERLLRAIRLAQYAINVYRKLEHEWEVNKRLPKRVAPVRQSRAKTLALLAELQLLFQQSNATTAGLAEPLTTHKNNKHHHLLAVKSLEDAIDLTKQANCIRLQIYGPKHDSYTRGLRFIFLWERRLGEIQRGARSTMTTTSS